jgi:phosphatidylethanolamine-binding protein (PEBP) family uncharacterized protein
MIKPARLLAALIGVMLATPHLVAAKELTYDCSVPPLEVTFAVAGDHYSGAVNCGNLFLQSDIPAAPLVRWKGASAGKLYTLMMLDFDGNANGSWPDPVASGKNAPVRHWIVGNIPGDVLRGSGYVESESAATLKTISVVQPYRYPHIPVVSDRYAVYVFQQEKKIDFDALPDSIVNFDAAAFLAKYRLGAPKASNFFVAIFTSESPFSGKAFHGNDVSGVWHQGFGQGALTRGQK